MSFHVIKENNLFYLSNIHGNVPRREQNQFGYGLFMQDTRVLSEFRLVVQPEMLVELSADSSNNFESVYRYTNTAFQDVSGKHVGSEVLYLTRRQFVDGNCMYEECTIDNYSTDEITLAMGYATSVDFKDMFEVRGFSSMGNRTVSCETLGNVTRFSYSSIDNVRTVTEIQFSLDQQTQPCSVTPPGGANDEPVCLEETIAVPPRGQRRWLIVVKPFVDAGERVATHVSTLNQQVFNESIENVSEALNTARRRVQTNYRKWFEEVPRIEVEPQFRQWYTRGLTDIRMLLTDIGHGLFPVAGVPWYAVPFGRDSLIAAWQLLPVNVGVAKGTLLTMAAHQGQSLVPERDEQPGKIMHELRDGELTRSGQLPFGPYYGTIDATPLFLNLAVDYFEWTGDEGFIQQIMPNVERAFAWIQNYGDRDGDGFVEYFREASKGISNQGWKDSGDCIVHVDGRLAEGSIALCEVQGYVYRAYQKWSSIFEYFNKVEQAKACSLHANDLQVRFLKSFWLEEEDVIALALDGAKQPVKSASSNMGQVLWSGILPDDIANRVVNRLMAEDMFSGYGIRTLSKESVAYNPLSYHNGSVWPHDNAMILAGFAKYGRHDAVSKLVGGLLAASADFALGRLPELFAGFGVEEAMHPVPYPVSCSPQAWAAGTPCTALQAILGLVPNVPGGWIQVRPQLPEGLPMLRIDGLRIGQGELSLLLHRTADGETTIHVATNTTGLPVQLAID